ncbi:tRNA (adenine(22)-N(1))-methyltransferase TrmK [Candidatus Micrarchaeota archaeon]|nr:tRNA (adenine(22)-N(1))-methyltransferase TrmK [Candidatus Micrarchaeota archaeon]
MAFPRAALRALDRRQGALAGKFRRTPGSGVIRACNGRKFIVFKNVFWAFYDNPLLEDFPVKVGESVLDVGTGTGVIAIFAAYKDAGRVLAVEVNPSAVKCARENARRHGFGKKIEVRLSDMFDSVRPDEKFDVIAANLPFRDKPAADLAEASMWDGNLRAHRKFFEGVALRLNPGGRIYVNQSNFGAVAEMKKLARKAGFSFKLFATKRYPKGNPLYPCEFYAFELKVK